MATCPFSPFFVEFQGAKTWNAGLVFLFEIEPLYLPECPVPGII